MSTNPLGAAGLPALPNPPHPGVRQDRSQLRTQCQAESCSHGCSPVLQLSGTEAVAGSQQDTTTTLSTHCSSQLIYGWSHHDPCEEMLGRGWEWGELHLCHQLLTRDLLSAEAGRGAVCGGADTGVTTTPPARASRLGSHHAEAAMSLQQGQQWGSGGGCVTGIAALRHGEQAISDADGWPRTTSRQFQEAARRCSLNRSLQSSPTNGLHPMAPGLGCNQWAGCLHLISHSNLPAAKHNHF